MTAFQAGGSSGRVRGLRGAICIEQDTRDAVQSATRRMLTELVSRNGIGAENVISAIFTVTPDIVSDFPARAARELGWTDVPMLCSTEIPVPDSVPRVVRVLLHVELASGADARHVYLDGAEELRPDL